MANDLKRVGLIFTEEGAVDFKKTLQEVNLELNKNYNQFKLVQSQWDSSTKRTEKLRAEQEYLKNAYELQADKVSTLKMQLSDLENAEDKNTTAIKRKRSELTSAEAKLETYNKRLKEVTNQLKSFGAKVIEAGTKIENVGDKIEKAGKKVSAFSLATGTALVASAKSAIDFESAFTGVEKTVDGTEQQMEELKQGIRDMAKEIPSSTTEISAVAEAAGQLGIKTEDILSFTRVMIDLGNSTNLSAEEAASALAKFANITNMSAQDYSKLGATIVDLGNNFATTEADIVEMATRLAATGDLAGLSQSQILALATAMSSVGIEAEAGGSAMSKLLKQIQVAVETGSDDLNDFAKVAGMSSSEFKKAFEQDAVKALSAFISGLNDTERNGKSAIVILEEMGLTEVRLSNTVLSLANASDVMTDAIDTASTAWEDNTALTNEANKRYDTLESKIKICLNKLKDFAITIGNKLMPSIETIIDKIGDFAEWLSNLSEEQVDNIVKTGLMVTAIGPLVTIIGKVTSTAGGAIKAIGTFTQAIGVVRGTVTTTSTAVNGLASVIGAIKSPVGLAILAITALTGAFTYLALKQTEEQKIAKDLSKEMAEQKQEIEAYNQSIDNTTNANLAQINSVSKLKDELGSLVDENGRVKEGYESRVSFILNQLNEALGTEYELNGNIVKSYQDLQNEIDNTIEKQRAKIILNGEEEKYTEAIQKQGEAVENLKQIQDQLGMTIDEAKQKYSELYNALDNYYKNPAQSEYTSAEILNMTKQLDSLQNLIKGYNDAEYAVQLYTNNIKKYEDDYALYTEGKYNEIYNSIVGTTQNITNTTTQGLKQSIEEQQKNLQLYQEQVKNTGNEVSQEYANQAEQNLNQLINELYNRTTTIGELGQNEVEAWKQLATNSYDKYSEKMKQIPEETRRKIEEATGVVGSDVNLANASGELAQKATVSFENNSNGERAGRNFVSGVKTGLANKSEVDGAVSASGSLGSKILNKFKDILGIHSPSKEAEEAAEYFLEGFVLGINENQKNALKSISNLAGNINDELNNGLDSNDYKVKTKRSSNFSYNQVSQDIIQLVNDSNQKIIDLLTQILEKSGQSIVLDTGILVGETIDKIDTELGDRQSRRERGS